MILFIVFAETGLFAGFFLPGDALLFVTGIFSSTDRHGAGLCRLHYLKRTINGLTLEFYGY